MEKFTEKIKPIAVVLPQYYPIPENNQWWGEGFTEWTNVVKGRPRFSGHYQPHLPKDLGFYDLRLPEAREAQAELARKFGVYGFCYYHYWFNGRRLLEKPVDEILESGKPDFPFMLCWANENWSRNWDGSFNEILIRQTYSVEDFILHARHLVKYFSDPRYIKVGGRPIFAIYKDLEIDNLEMCISAFRKELKIRGIDVFLCRFERWVGTSVDFEKAFRTFDAGIEFQPFSRQFWKIYHPKKEKYLNFIRPNIYLNKVRTCFGLKKRSRDKIYLYENIVNNDLGEDFQQGRPIFPGVCPGWDNSARRPGDGALILDKSSPDLFRFWVEKKIRQSNWELIPERFLFINAWNEWAEGNHLEPCERWGTHYLAALQEGIRSFANNS